MGMEPIYMQSTENQDPINAFWKCHEIRLLLQK